MNKNKGFTLIELLVVIAIIGILSSVVLASLNTARDKGANAAAKANINNIRAQAELVYDDATPNSYDGVCGDETIMNALDAASDATGNDDNCDDAAAAWAAEIELKNESFYCVDSTGNAVELGATKGVDTTVCE